jgi:hypothetical protein
MKLVQSLASVVAGVVMLATVGNSSASALDFNLSGKLDNGDTLSGTYSYSGDTLAPNTFEDITSFSVSIDNSSGTPIDTFNNGNSTAEIAEISNQNLTSSAELHFVNYSSSSIDLYFPSTFTGSGDISNQRPSSYISSILGSGDPINIITRASSTPVVTQAVPEPSTIAGMVLGSVGLMAARFKYKKQKAFSAT